MIEKNKTQANSMRLIEVTEKECPLSCPMPSSDLWDSHPKVFLPIEKTGKATCPYCACQYILTDHKQK